MARSQTDRRALARATIVSLALHALALPLFATTATLNDSDASFARAGFASSEVTRVTMLRFDRRDVPRPSPTAPRATPMTSTSTSPSAKHIPRTVRYAPPRSQLARNVEPLATPDTIRPSAVRRPGVTETQQRSLAPRPRNVAGSIALTLATAAPELSTQATAPAFVPERPLPQTPAPPGPSPAPSAPVATPIAVAARGGDLVPGAWGQSFAKPLVADDDALAELREKYRGVRAISVAVDAEGHATHVDIPAAVTGEARDEIARVLATLRYIPAECNGLRCAATLVLAL